MLHCLTQSSSARRPNLHTSPPLQQGISVEGTPRSSAQPSPTINLTHEYNLTIQTNSYREIWNRIHTSDPSHEDPDSVQGEAHEEQQLLAEILNPSRECVAEALRHAKPGTLTRLVSAYFDHSESTFHRCLDLRNSVIHARFLYHDLNSLLDVLPLDSDSNSLTQSQCERAFDVFLQFDRLENPFPRPDSHFHDMRHCFSQLKQQLDYRRCKSHSRVRLLRRATTCSAICLIGTVIGVAITAAAIASHALVALIAGPLIPAFLPSKITKKELAYLAQLDAASRGTSVQHDLDTINRLVECLYDAVETDKSLIRFGLKSGRDRHPIHEVAKQLQKNHHNFLNKLTVLEEHMCRFFTAINKARSFLLKEIHLHQPHYS